MSTGRKSTSKASKASQIPPVDSSSSYSNPLYWDNRVDLHHEWYYSYDHLRPLIMQSLSSTLPTSTQNSSTLSGEDIVYLEIGCGNIPLVQSMINDPEIDGKLIGIDFSTSIINTLNENLDHQLQLQISTSSSSSTADQEQQPPSKKLKTSKTSPTSTSPSPSSSTSPSPSHRLEYKYMDARSLQYPNNSINYIIDKGTIDAMLCSKKWKNNIQKIFSEMCRVLKDVGFIMIISHLHYESDEFQEILTEIMHPILLNYHHRRWEIEIHGDGNSQSDEEEGENGEEDGNEEDEEENEEGDDNEDEGEKKNTPSNNATVYIIKSHQRKVTRSLKEKKSLPIPMKVLTYETE